MAALYCSLIMLGFAARVNYAIISSPQCVFTHLSLAYVICVFHKNSMEVDAFYHLIRADHYTIRRKLILNIRGCMQKFPDWPPRARTQMVQLSATMCSCIAILWVSLVSSAAIILCVASQRVFIVVVYFVIHSVRKLLDTHTYTYTYTVTYIHTYIHTHTHTHISMSENYFDIKVIYLLIYINVFQAFLRGWSERCKTFPYESHFCLSVCLSLCLSVRPWSSIRNICI
jgi:hypothetical protein